MKKEGTLDSAVSVADVAVLRDLVPKSGGAAIVPHIPERSPIRHAAEFGREFICRCFGLSAERIHPSLGELRKEVTRLQDRDRLKTKYVAAAAHDISNCAATLDICLQMLNRVVENEETHELSEIILNSICRINHLSGDLVDWAAMEKGMFRLKKTNFSIDQWLHQTVRAFNPRAASQKVAIEVFVEPRLADIEADSSRITQVMMNLLENALRHTPSGGWIKVRAYGFSREVQISVEDNGSGMDSEKQYWFAKETDAPSTVRPDGRLGLGLSIVKTIVHAHGGRVKVYSEGLGKGCTFSFSLPLNQNVDTNSLPA